MGSGIKTRPKARRHKQGAEVKLCPLPPNTTEGAFKKEAQVQKLDSERAGRSGGSMQQTAAEYRTANGGGWRHHHRQPDVKQGGAAGYLGFRRRRAPRQRRTLTCRAVPAVTHGDCRAEEAKRNSGNPA